MVNTRVAAKILSVTVDDQEGGEGGGGEGSKTKSQFCVWVSSLSLFDFARLTWLIKPLKFSILGIQKMEVIYCGLLRHHLSVMIKKGKKKIC